MKLAFKDDVVVRVEFDVGGTRLDIRSVSRFGRSDLGVNADRVGEVFSLYQIETDWLPERVDEEF